MDESLSMGTSFEGEPEQSCILVCREQQCGAIRWVCTPHGSRSTGAPVHSVLLSGCSPCIPSLQLPDPEHVSSTLGIACSIITVTQRCSVLNCQKYSYNPVVVCIELLVFVRPSQTQSQYYLQPLLSHNRTKGNLLNRWHCSLNKTLFLIPLLIRQLAEISLVLFMKIHAYRTTLPKFNLALIFFFLYFPSIVIGNALFKSSDDW